MYLGPVSFSELHSSLGTSRSDPEHCQLWLNSPQYFEPPPEQERGSCPSPSALTIADWAAFAPGGERAGHRSADPGSTADATLPAQADLASGSGRRKALPVGKLLPFVQTACRWGPVRRQGSGS